MLVVKDPKHLQADSEDSYQPVQMRRLIWVFAGRTYRFVGNAMPGLYDYTFTLLRIGIALIPHVCKENYLHEQ